MISLKLAFRSVFRRPQQNIAVILGIALGVSLFVGVQVGGDSLNAGLLELSIHSIGERDGAIQPTLTPYFVTPDIISLETNPNVTEIPSFSEQIRNNESISGVRAFSERLHLTMTALQPELGSIEVGNRFSGIPRDQDPAFGSLYNRDGEIIEIADLADHEIYIGEATVEELFGQDDPIGKNLTLQTTLFSQAQPQAGIESIAIPLAVNMTIADVFLDRGMGRELFSDFIISPLDVVQDMVYNAFEQAKFEAFLEGDFVIGYGDQPLTDIYFVYNEGIELGTESEAIVTTIENTIASVVSTEFSSFFSVSDTRKTINEQVDAATEGLELLLNGFGAIIILAGVLVIINIQSMALAARERETGILRAIGAKRGQIIRANLIESVFLGVFGSIVGLGGGILYGRLLVAFLGIAFGFDTGDIPTVVAQESLVSSFIAGFVLSQVTGLIPAINASRVNIARVLRGIDAPESEEFGRKTLYFGFLFTIIAIIGIYQLDPNPLIDGNEAFKNLDNVSDAYLPFALLIIGPAMIMTHFKGTKFGISFIGFFLLGWAYFNIFYILDLIESGSGGLTYILLLIGSLLIATVIIMAVNLGGLAAAGQRISSWLARSSETPVRGTTMVAFRKMKSKVTRSTLTFALFATILTLNIWIGTFSYSFRYGVDTQVVALTGGSDSLILSPDNALPESLDFDQKLLDEFNQASGDTYFTDVKSFSVVQDKLYYRNSTDPTTQRTYRGVSVSQDALWKDNTQEDWIFPFDLADNKTGTPFETYEDKEDDPAATFEDEAVWKALANNETIPNKDGVEKPIIITTLIFDFGATSFDIVKRQGDSIFLNMTDGRVQEFVIGGISNGNPLSDYQTSEPNGPPGATPTFFISDAWKTKLQGFSGFGVSDNAFLSKTNAEDANDKAIPQLLQQVERWANSGEFQKEYGLYGLIGISTYEIYEERLEGQFRFFQFLQAFVSLGFAVGILGLVVVASRSVAERKREIGMLRALGFRRRDVVVSVVLELIVMGMIGLFIGFINGTVMGYALTSVNGGTQFLIPWGLVAIYGLATLFSAILAAIFPAIRASQIPPSDALRYTG